MACKAPTDESLTCDVAQSGKRTAAASKLWSSQPPLHQCCMLPVPVWLTRCIPPTTTNSRPIARRELQHRFRILQRPLHTLPPVHCDAGPRRDLPLGSRCTQNINTRSPAPVPRTPEQPPVPQCAFATGCARPLARIQGCDFRIPPLLCYHCGRDQADDACEEGR